MAVSSVTRPNLHQEHHDAVVMAVALYRAAFKAAATCVTRAP
jgi:hypothetical protein